MYIIKCDRCGKEKTLKNLVPFFKSDPQEPEEMPKYSIMKIGEEIQTITLCKECEAEFEYWLHNYR